MKIKKDGFVIPIAFGISLMLCFLFELIICKRSYELLHIIYDKISLPPLWIFSSLYILCLFLLGVGAGFFVKEIFDGRASLQSENTILKGAIFCIPACFFILLWYPLLFSIQMPLLSVIFAFLSLILLIISLLFWLRASILYSLFVFPCVIWSAYLLITSLILVFKI